MPVTQNVRCVVRGLQAYALVHMERMRIYSATALVILMGVSSSCAQVNRHLTEADAIRVAERFVEENGYTDLAPADKTKLSFESLDAADPEERLKHRYNTLERKAYCVGGGSPGKYGWTIVFHYNANNEIYRQIIPNFDQQVAGRAVTMSPDGSNIKMQHQDIYLSGLRVIDRDDK